MKNQALLSTNKFPANQASSIDQLINSKTYVTPPLKRNSKIASGKIGQGKTISFIVHEAFVSAITTWKEVTNKLLANIFRLCQFYLVFDLANNSNLHRWKTSNNGLCSLCNKLQTELHVLNNCKHA